PQSMAWRQLTPAGLNPERLAGHVAAFDPMQDAMVVYGGTSTTTWVLTNPTGDPHGATPTWTQVQTSGEAPPPGGGSAAYLAEGVNRTGALTVFGGRYPDGTYSNSTTVLEGVFSATPTWHTDVVGGTPPAARTD